MKQNLRNSDNKNNRVFGRLAAEKKRTVIAVCLITVMVFMWVRVLGRKGPQSANAAVVAQEVTEGQMNSKLNVSFMELPKVKGRNDVLTRDFFAVGSWRDFMRGGEGKSGGIEEVSVVSRDGSEETVRRVAGKLKLEAIMLGKNPLAIINDMRLSVGDKLFVRDETSTYECEVTEIKEDAVSIRCGETEITLRLTQTPIIDN
jgi:hypothetical protein